jgi:predicted PurR-regulated permease PerM
MPTFERVSHYLQILLIVAVAMYFTKVLTIPMMFGLLVAIVTYPLCKRLEKHLWSDK